MYQSNHQKIANKPFLLSLIDLFANFNLNKANLKN